MIENDLAFTLLAAILNLLVSIGFYSKKDLDRAKLHVLYAILLAAL